MNLRCVEFEFSVKYLSENVQQVVGDRMLKLCKDTWAEALSSLIASTQTVNEDTVLSDMRQKVCRVRRDERNSPTWEDGDLGCKHGKKQRWEQM